MFVVLPMVLALVATVRLQLGRAAKVLLTFAAGGIGAAGWFGTALYVCSQVCD
jgi:purine-cytosine permease-like protein